MRILALIQGRYGQRKVDHLRHHAPASWALEVWEAPPRLPLIIEDPADFLPGRFFPADLVLALGESSGAAQLIPALAQRAQARSVIAPADVTAWLPHGLEGQLRQELEALGVAADDAEYEAGMPHAHYIGAPTHHRQEAGHRPGPPHDCALDFCRPRGPP